MPSDRQGCSDCQATSAAPCGRNGFRQVALPPTRCVGLSGVIEIGMFSLELLQPFEQLIEFVVGYLRRLLLIIEIVMVLDLAS